MLFSELRLHAQQKFVIQGLDIARKKVNMVGSNVQGKWEVGYTISNEV